MAYTILTNSGQFLYGQVNQVLVGSGIISSGAGTSVSSGYIVQLQSGQTWFGKITLQTVLGGAGANSSGYAYLTASGNQGVLLRTDMVGGSGWQQQSTQRAEPILQCTSGSTSILLQTGCQSGSTIVANASVFGQASY